MNLIFDSHDFFASLVIEDMQPDQTFQGFTHDKGRMRVEHGGIYYIYAQVFFDSYYHPHDLTYNRVALMVKSGTEFSLMQAGQKPRDQPGRPDYGNYFTGGIIALNSGDEIYLETVYRSSLWVAKRHTFFGAYKIE